MLFLEILANIRSNMSISHIYVFQMVVNSIKSKINNTYFMPVLAKNWKQNNENNYPTETTFTNIEVVMFYDLQPQFLIEINCYSKVIGLQVAVTNWSSIQYLNVLAKHCTLLAVPILYNIGMTRFGFDCVFLDVSSKKSIPISNQIFLFSLAV